MKALGMGRATGRACPNLDAFSALLSYTLPPHLEFGVLEYLK